MDSMNLLVTDQSPELAERINSVLRNSGIKIHVIHTSKVLDVKKALDQVSPLLVIYANPDAKTTSIEEVDKLTQQYGVPLALYSDFEDSKDLISKLKRSACIVIHSESESQLTDIVKQLVARYESTRNQSQQNQQMEELEHRYELLLGSARDAMAYIHEGLHVYANRAYLEALNVTNLSDIEGLSLLEFMKAEGTDLKKVFRGFSKGVFPQDVLEVFITRPDGTEFEASLAFSPAKYDGEECIQMLVHELDAAASMAAEIEKMRITDSLTKLRNKRSFADLLDLELEKPHSTDSVAAILYLEPDGITEMQDEMDVSEMDAFLVKMAHVLKSSIGKKDEAARISDHGLAVLTRQTDMDHVEALSEKILKAFSGKLIELEHRSLSVSCSIGIATLGRLASNSASVMANARKAHSEAAGSGNTAVTSRPQLMAVSSFSDDRQWIDRIKVALSRNDFYSVQHSIIDLEGEGEQLMENLTHLKDEAGDLSPKHFIDIADRNDLAGTIDRFIIPGLLKSFVESSDRQVISLSGNSILDYGFPAWLIEQIKESCADATKLVIQINNAVAQANMKPIQRLMEELGPLGCKLSISNFDGERRSLQLLDHLGASYVKIRPELTEDLTQNATGQKVVRKIVDIAESKNVLVIADEVTDTSSLAIIWQCGVKLIAGAFLKDSAQVAAQ